LPSIFYSHAISSPVLLRLDLKLEIFIDDMRKDDNTTRKIARRDIISVF
jgi:hypothetical protein